MAEDKQVSADEIFKQFKEHSISEFFRRNSQMLGYSGRVRSLTTIVHEYVSNSLDACEEAGILPEISVEIRQLDEDKYSVKVSDNGPGIPSKHVGKALATVLAGTKFNRYVQQRGQQGIGASGCTLYSQITTGKPIHVSAFTSKEGYECDITIDIKGNKPIISGMANSGAKEGMHGTSIYGEFGDVKYENSDHGVYEYLKRTALSNPHASIKLLDPEGKEIIFMRSTEEMPSKPKQIKPHPLGIGTNDLIEFAHRSESRKLSAFLMETFSRISQGKIAELKAVEQGINFEMDPHQMKWDDAEKLVRAFKQIKWIAPELDSLSTIGEKQMGVAIKNILNPTFQSVIERKPKVFKGGVPFVVEAGIAYGGGAGKEVKEKKTDETRPLGEESPLAEGNVLRFANKVPLLFDASNCAITDAVKTIQWKRYGIANFDEEPISVMVNVSSVYVPYSGVGKQAIAQEEEIIEEIKLAVMDCGRTVQRYISGVRNMKAQESRYKTIMRYVSQLSKDLSDITAIKQEKIEEQLKSLIERKYKSLFEAPDIQQDTVPEGEENDNGKDRKEKKGGAEREEED